MEAPEWLSADLTGADVHGVRVPGEHVAVPVTLLQLAALASACLGGAAHGAAMAVRKRYGEGHPEYWKEWRWWLGTGLDGFAGMLIWPAMPHISVQLLMPMVVVVQLATSYLLGLFFFGETGTCQSHAGVACAIAGVVGLSFSTPTGAAHFHIDDFWACWIRGPFLIASAACAAVLAGVYCAGHRTTFWALAAGFLEGVQFICSRSLADAVIDSFWAIFWNLAVTVAIWLKISCIVLILHFQQLGLEHDMSRFAGIYLIASTLFICVYGAVFFGDAVPLTLPFAVSSMATLAGIWFLNAAEERDESEHDGARAPLLGAAPADVEAKPGASGKGGAEVPSG